MGDTMGDTISRDEADHQWPYRLEWSIGPLCEEGLSGVCVARGWMKTPEPDEDGFFRLEAFQWPQCPVERETRVIRPGPYYWIYKLKEGKEWAV